MDSRPQPPKDPHPTTAIVIPAYGDGYQLGGYLITPSSPQPDGPIVILATATAVPCAFYRPFLWFLANHGIYSIGFDYRGTHSSVRNQPESLAATAEDWGTKDFAGVIDYTSKNFPNKKIVVIGHSVGGHILPWPYNSHKISHAITVGAQNAFYPLTPFRFRHQLFWNVYVPAACSIFGSFPGSKLQIVGDAPVGVMKEWRSWAFQPNYIAGVTKERKEQYKNFDKPILAISVDDDEYATRLGVQLFHQELGSPVQFWHVDHSDVPGKLPIKHIGFFSRLFAKTLWPKVVPFVKSGTLPNIDSLEPNSLPPTDLRCRL